MFGVAQHLNTWMSFDIGRSRVALPNADMELPSPRSGDATTELLALLPFSRDLDPNAMTNVESLELALNKVLDRSHSIRPTILAQTNLMLTICRRLRTLNHSIAGDLSNKVLGLTVLAIRSVESMVETNDPWNHVVNIPFQVICMMLSLDTPAAIAQLPPAVKCLRNVAAVYPTNATQEALRTACLLISLHQKRKEADSKALLDVVQFYSPTAASDYSAFATSRTGDDNVDFDWLSDLVPGLHDFQPVDWDTFVQ